jgi:F-type H+-transporting ATPase subunit delta
MANVNEKETAVARIYSEALFQVATAGRQEADVLEQLGDLASLAADQRSFADFLASPMIDAKDRAVSIEKMFRGRLGDVVVDALQVINRKGRLALVPAIAEQFRQLLRDRDQRVDVSVRTAIPLTDGLREEIKAAVAKFTGRQPDLHETVEPELIGGIVLQVEDRKVDASVLHEIGKYRRRFADRGRREIFRSREAAP